MQIQFRQDGSLYVGWSKKYTRNGVVRERQQAVILPQLPLAEPRRLRREINQEIKWQRHEAEEAAKKQAEEAKKPSRRKKAAQ